MEKTFVNNSKGNYSIIGNVLNKEFVISAIIPIIIFSIFNKANQPLNGVILSGLWSIGVVLINLIKEHKVNVIAAMAATFSAVGVAGSIISRSATFYLMAPMIQDILYALVFFGSLLFKKPLIQVIVEQTYLKNAPQSLRDKLNDRSLWVMLTAAWGILNITQAALRFILLHSVSTSSYYAINTTYTNISTSLLIAFCVAAPKWYKKFRQN